jgi:hypothetical protein
VPGNRPANLGTELVDNHRHPYAGDAPGFQIQIAHGRLNGTNAAAVLFVVAAQSKKTTMISRDCIFKEPASPATFGDGAQRKRAKSSAATLNLTLREQRPTACRHNPRCPNKNDPGADNAATTPAFPDIGSCSSNYPTKK